MFRRRPRAVEMAGGGGQAYNRGEERRGAGGWLQRGRKALKPAGIQQAGVGWTLYGAATAMACPPALPRLQLPRA